MEIETRPEKDLELAREIVDKGLTKAAESLSFFMQETIKLETTSYDKELSAKLVRNNDKILTVLTTDLMGDLKGSCYLILNESETNQLLEVALPQSVRDDEKQFAVLKDAMLLEVDNIISAAVVSVFSNLLKFKMFGGVPKIDFMTGDDFSSLLIENKKPDKLLLGFKSNFTSEKSSFSPEFIWSIEPKFFEGVKNYEKSED